MPESEQILAGPFHGLNRRVSTTMLSASETPDTTDAGNPNRNVGALGPRMGRQRFSTGTYNLLGLGMLNAAFGRYKVLCDANGDWTASGVTWGGVAPFTPSSPTVSGKDTTAIVRSQQYKERVYFTNGRNRPQAFNGDGWANMGILGGIDLPQWTPTITLGGGSVAQIITASADGSKATLTSAVAHGFTVGLSVVVLLSDTQFNGTFAITDVPSSTTFKYVLAVTQSSESVVGTATGPTAAGITALSSSRASHIITITTDGAHHFAVGQQVQFDSPKFFDGVVTGGSNILAVTSTTFTFDGRDSTPSTDGANYATFAFPAGQEPTVTAVGATSTQISGSYYYMIAPTNSSRLDANGRGIEGIPSEVSAAAEPSDQSVTITGIPATHPDSQVDYWNIYRTTNDGFDTGLVPAQQDFFYLGRVAIGTTTYTDTTDDDSGWYLSGTAFNCLRFNQNIPPTVKHLVEYGDRLFGWGFDPIVGTCTVANASANLTASSVTLPDGVKGCYIRFSGENVRYEIKTRPTTTTITLDRPYEGSHTTTTSFTIFRNPWELYFSEFRDADAWGPDGEQRRNILEVPGRQAIVGGVSFEGSLLIFTATEIFVVNGKGPNRFDVRILPDPAYSGFGAVSGDCVFRVDNEVHFLSLDGPAKVTSSGQFFEPQLYGVNLNTDWLDGLSSTELSRSVGGSDGRAVWYSVPVSGQTLNSKTYRFERDMESWWEETETHPLRFIRQDGTDGLLAVLFYLQGKSVVRPAFGSVDLVSAALTGSRTGSNSSSLTDSTAAFPTTNGGLVECYIRIYSAAATLLATRRIISNTSTAVTWSLDPTLPGSGSYTAAAGTTYEIGNVSYYWETRTLEQPGHLMTTSELAITFEPIT